MVGNLAISAIEDGGRSTYNQITKGLKQHNTQVLFQNRHDGFQAPGKGSETIEKEAFPNEKVGRSRNGADDGAGLLLLRRG